MYFSVKPKPRDIFEPTICLSPKTHYTNQEFKDGGRPLVRPSNFEQLLSPVV